MFGLYLHVPFCLRRCAYCDFYSQTDEALMPRYVEAVCSEMTLRRDETDKQISTVYVGGGTPSQLPIGQIERLFDCIGGLFDLSQCREVTFECNPDDLTPRYISELRTTRVNRLSIGVQSFDDHDLRLLSRRHTALQAKTALLDCHAAGFHRLSIDLMYGLPGQTLPGWEKNLREAFALPIDHLSAYHLTYEEGTLLHRRLKRGEVDEVDEERSVDLFRLLRQEAQQAGMEQYEISNFCRPGCHALHNTSYWQGVPYLGVGASAHSYNGHTRSVTRADVGSYIASIEAGQLPVERERLTDTDRYNDYIITRLRTKWGIVCDELEKEFGLQQKIYCMEQAQEHLRRGDLALQNGCLTVSPEGILRSDGIMADLLFVD